jgi:hypothetical protein
MKLTGIVTDHAVLSNVGESSEFKIKNSARAFSILSSGLYANKIRAIIRELSCNAVDSHIAAGKQDVPYVVHLPSHLEPWFSIRDYGTGLSHNQVINIFTTYFESTKTDSNDFIGALGLGSKSPFSYTDNFSITAIKDNVKGIYSAYINDEGVPSVVQMTSEPTTEENGVEIKFSIPDNSDVYRFSNEAREVYTHFNFRPVIEGYAGFEFLEPSRRQLNMIDGVHLVSGSSSSFAVMGNIKYPIDVPNANANLGKLAALLQSGLEINFNIGEVDFQASREGLSYTELTISAIRNKLEILNENLGSILENEANAITNKWHRAMYISEKLQSYIWNDAVIDYLNKYPLESIDYTKSYSRVNNKVCFLGVTELKEKYNITIQSFKIYRSVLSIKKPTTYYGNGTDVDVVGWKIPVQENVFFVTNQSKTGAFERAKFHWKTSRTARTGFGDLVFVLQPADKTKLALFNEFFEAIYGPPEEQIVDSAALSVKPRKKTVSVRDTNMTILKLEKGYGLSGIAWSQADKNSLDAANTYYYVPLSGYTMINNKHGLSAKELFVLLHESGIKELQFSTIYGIRKGDLPFIQTQSNWINLDSYIEKVLTGISDDEICGYVLTNKFANNNILSGAANLITGISTSSPYYKIASQIKNTRSSFNFYKAQWLFNHYTPNRTINISELINEYDTTVEKLEQRYPLLNFRYYSTYRAAMVEYINLIDAAKGID